MRINKLKTFIFGSIYATFSLVGEVRAAVLTNPLKANTFAEVVQGFAKILTQVGVPLAAIFLIYAGFLFVSARGDEKQLETAKKTFWWTVVGTALLVGAYAIATAIVDFAEKL